MTRKDDIVDDLYRHCIAEGSPSLSLLENGEFPAGWVEQYLELLEEAKQLWLQEELWPQKLVAAIHVTSFYLDSRYKAWCNFNNKSKPETEELFPKIRVQSEFFLLNSLTKDVKRNNESLDGSY